MSALEQPIFDGTLGASLLATRPNFIEFLPIAIYACDAEGKLCWFNRRAVDLWGRAPRIGDSAELFCGSFKLFDLAGTVIQREETPMATVLRLGIPVHDREAVVERPDGSRIFAMVHIDPVLAPDGEVVGAINCFHDTSELHKIKTEIKESGAIVRQVLDALPAAIYTTDPEGRLTYYNRAAVELAGREPKLGSDEWCVTWKLYEADGTPLPHDQCPMAVALKENRAIRDVEAIAERPDGTRRPFIPFPTPLRDLSGKLVGAVNMLVDISERKDSETRQRMLMAELNHRVKNNMMMLQALLTGAKLETDSAEAREVLRDAGHRIAAMAAAQRMLYTASDAHAFEAGAFVEELANAFQNMSGEHATISCECDAGTLPTDAAVPIALILNELVTNALKYGAQPDGTTSVKIDLKRQDDEWTLCVRDTGPGFAPGAPGRRFSGLGLVQNFASQLHGSLAVRKDRGAVCTVRFRLNDRGS
jgi:PAS domain S-box-containing protein